MVRRHRGVGVRAESFGVVADQCCTPLSFSSFLRESGIDPAGVLRLRHRDPKIQQQLYSAAIAGDPRFDDYQRSQSAPQVLQRFQRATHIAGFVAGPTGDCMFVGVWALKGPSGEVYHDPFPGMLPSDNAVTMFETEHVAALDGYRGRLVVNWGKQFIAWAQWAGKGEKEIVELRREVVEPPFPGYIAARVRVGPGRRPAGLVGHGPAGGRRRLLARASRDRGPVRGLGVRRRRVLRTVAELPERARRQRGNAGVGRRGGVTTGAQFRRVAATSDPEDQPRSLRVGAEDVQLEPGVQAGFDGERLVLSSCDNDDAVCVTQIVLGDRDEALVDGADQRQDALLIHGRHRQ